MSAAAHLVCASEVIAATVPSVDDFRAVVRADRAAEWLRGYGFDVSMARHPRSALVMVETYSPEVALLDSGLPEMDGCELARRIAQTKPDCRLIALTGYGDEGARARTREAGFSIHLVKPVDAATLLAAIEGGNAIRLPRMINASCHKQASATAQYEA